LGGDEAASLLAEAVERAAGAGLRWMEDKLTLKPTPELAKLIQRSQEISAKDDAEGE
jgi:hypothetical protein